MAIMSVELSTPLEICLKMHLWIRLHVGYYDNTLRSGLCPDYTLLYLYMHVLSFVGRFSDSGHEIGLEKWEFTALSDTEVSLVFVK